MDLSGVLFRAVPGGAGAVGEAGGVGAPNTVVNQGLIAADAPGRTLTIAPDVFNNTGTLQATGGGVLSVNNLQGNAGTVTVTGTGSQMTLGGTYTINSPISVDAGTLSLNGSWNNAAGVMANN